MVGDGGVDGRFGSEIDDAGLMVAGLMVAGLVMVLVMAIVLVMVMAMVVYYTLVC